MKILRLFSVLAVTLVLAACSVQSAGPSSDELTWTLPTQRLGGAVLPVGEIAKTTVNQFASASSTTVLSTVDVPAPGTKATFPRSGTGVGTLCYEAYVTDVAGLASAPTARLCKTVAAAPSSPAGLTVS